jgi:4-hydroxybenzoyl-CoA reductase subunit beta
MPIAGGTDLVPNMKHGLFSPGHLVALSRVPELHGVELRPGGLRIGATMILADVAAHPLVRMHAPSLADAAGRVAGPQLRNAGTIGGNVCLDTRCTYYNQSHFWRSALGYCLKKDGEVCHVTKVGRKCVAAHSADTPPVLMTLGASMELASATGTRTHKVGDFFIADGIWNNVRKPDELVTSITVPLAPTGRFAAFEKLRQRGSIDFPLLNVAVAGELSEDRTIADLRVVVSALGSRPRVVSGLDKVAVGQAATPELLDAVAERAHAQCHPLDNIIVDPEWRRAMVPVHVRRALTRALSDLDAVRAA